MFLVAAAVSLCLMFWVDTYAWFVRSNALSNGSARVIAKSNLIMYSSRAFAFVFQFSIAYYLEAFKLSAGIFEISLIGFFLAALIHFTTFYCEAPRRHSWRAIVFQLTAIRRWDSQIMNIELPPVKPWKWTKLTMATAASTAIFGMALAIPYLLAFRNPDYRLTYGSLIQLLNFLGTLFLLYFVDPILYKRMDEGTLRETIYEYISGRIFGFFISFSLILVVFIIFGRDN